MGPQIRWTTLDGRTHRRSYDAITRFPSTHPKVQGNETIVCGNLEPGAFIPAYSSWGYTSRPEEGYGEHNCSTVTGAEAFYGYHCPYGNSANPGRYLEDYTLVYMVVDSSSTA